MQWLMQWVIIMDYALIVVVDTMVGPMIDYNG